MDRAQMLTHLDAKAGAVRSCYITISPGQEATYLLKEQQARAWVASGFAGAAPSLVDAEMVATGMSAADACTSILTQAAQWAYLAGQVEKARRVGKIGIVNAATDAEAEAVFNTAMATLIAWML